MKIFLKFLTLTVLSKVSFLERMMMNNSEKNIQIYESNIGELSFSSVAFLSSSQSHYFFALFLFLSLSRASSSSLVEQRL